MGTRLTRVSVKLGRSKPVEWDDSAMLEIIDCTAGSIKKAAKALKDGNLVAFPTETVYGLGADATNEGAVRRLYTVKGRPVDHPVIVHIPSVQSLEMWADEIPFYALKLANEFWPGPMTLILKRSVLARDYITGRQNNVGIRVPAHSSALELLHEFKKIGGKGVVAPSANRFGAVSPTTAAAVKLEIGPSLSDKDQILDGGQSLIGVESTIIDCTAFEPKILRPGAITFDLIKKSIGDFSVLNKSLIKASGMLALHYSPSAKVLLGPSANPGEGFLALANIQTPVGAIRLAAPIDVPNYARDLYCALRLGDQQGLSTIVALPPEGTGLSEAIRDRLNKAAGQ